MLSLNKKDVQKFVNTCRSAADDHRQVNKFDEFLDPRKMMSLASSDSGSHHGEDQDFLYDDYQIDIDSSLPNI